MFQFSKELHNDSIKTGTSDYVATANASAVVGDGDGAAADNGDGNGEKDVADNLSESNLTKKDNLEVELSQNDKVCLDRFGHFFNDATDAEQNRVVVVPEAYVGRAMCYQSENDGYFKASNSKECEPLSMMMKHIINTKEVLNILDCNKSYVKMMDARYADHQLMLYKL